MRTARLLLVTLALTVPVAACGDDDDDGGGGGGGGEADVPTTVRLAATGSGKKSKLSIPKSVQAGLVEVQFENSAKGPIGVQFIRATDGHTADEALKAGAAWGEKGKPLPPWVKLEGGAPDTKPGTTSTTVQVLPAGNYIAVDIDSNVNTKFTALTGGGTAKVPAADSTVDASEYKFVASGLKVGANKVKFANVGKQPHLMVAAPIKGNKSVQDIIKAFQSEGDSGGPPPIDEKNEVSTSILDGGGSQVIDLDFAKKGRYAAICFVPDRAGGPPHIVKGMVSEIEVE